MSSINEDDRTWGSLSHLTALSGLIIPFGSVLAPLIIWRTRGRRASFVGDQALESLNFNISVSLAFVVCLALVWVLFIGILMITALVIYWIVMTVLATIKAAEGESYRYPINLRLIT
jgi:uncharacterized Tic20 family protein